MDGTLHECYLELLGFSTKLCELNLYRVLPARLILSSVFTIIVAINVGKWIADVDPRTGQCYIIGEIDSCYLTE